MDILKDIFAFLTDTNRHFSTKAILFVAVLLSAILINNMLGFTYYHNISNKIEKISAINQLLKDSTISSNNRVSLVNIREDVLNRKTIPESFYQKISDTYAQLANKSFRTTEDISSASMSKNTHALKSNIWFLLSTSGIYIIALILVVPFGLFSVLKSSQLFNGILGLIIVASVIYFLSAFNYYAFNLIPQIGDTWAWNYLLNVCLQLALLAIISIFFVRASNR